MIKFNIYSLVLVGGTNQPASLPIVPLTPGGLLIPFQPAPERSAIRSSPPLPLAGGYPSHLRNFADIQEQIEQKRTQLTQALQLATLNKQKSSPPPVISAPSATPNTAYASGNPFGSAARPTGGPIPSTNPTSYSQPSYSSSNVGSATSGAPNRNYFPL